MTQAREYLTRKCVLDLIHSLGRHELIRSQPGYYRHDEHHLARRHLPLVAACRKAYRRVSAGEDPETVMMWLHSQRWVDGNNRTNLILCALRGDFQRDEWWFARGGRGFHWVTNGGEFYAVDFGDDLNLPRVERVANYDVPKELQELDGSRRLADILPNPCTRLAAPARAL